MASKTAPSKIDNLVSEALLALQLGHPDDNTYHSLYKAWQVWSHNPSELKNIQNKREFGNGMMIFLSYGTISDIDTRQQISSVAYLFLSIAIDENPNDINLLKNRVLVMMGNEEDFRYTVQSATTSNVFGIGFLASMNQLETRDNLWKMIYTDISSDLRLCSIQMFADKKKDLDTKISAGFFSGNKSQSDIIKEGKILHNKVIQYLNSKVIDDEDVDF